MDEEQPTESIEKVEAEPTVEKEEKDPKLEKADILKMLSNALKIGTITKDQARHMREELGVNEADFTTKRVSDRVRRKKRKAQKQARKVTRQNGFKGQKMTKGQAAQRGR